ncbi:MAG TPA: cytidine deaminase [bacterium]|nr:cytidine deaminase [bacterium]
MSEGYVSCDRLSKSELRLLKAARSVMKNAYNIYSGFQVGAAVRTSTGKVYLGTFMENASFGLGVCAEVAAILAANTDGEAGIESIAIIGGKPESKRGTVVTPCGRCRQVILEASQVAGTDAEVICSNKDMTQVLRTTISELLPHAFGPRDLGVTHKLRSFLRHRRGRG